MHGSTLPSGEASLHCAQAGEGHRDPYISFFMHFIDHNRIKYPSVCQILKSKSVSSTGGPQVHHKDLTSVEGNLCGMTRPPCIGPARMCVYIGPRRRLDYQECISYCVHLAPSYHLRDFFACWVADEMDFFVAL
ncbi:hypothetical protein MUK42_36130 [Musa troglodytarum]|uniref:Uncharacterized protein n=1 Tax=Musa troglodytarum TaxID=320322 RepID=A0A9E7GH19_9LILI|nr:hypothetical protein MUK42_36130 [Musa troglodytarum]